MLLQKKPKKLQKNKKNKNKKPTSSYLEQAFIFMAGSSNFYICTPYSLQRNTVIQGRMIEKGWMRVEEMGKQQLTSKWISQGNLSLVLEFGELMLWSTPGCWFWLYTDLEGRISSLPYLWYIRSRLLEENFCYARPK